MIINKIENLQESTKLFLYKTIKTFENEANDYLKHPKFEVRRLITKFRISDHTLLIEIGRYKKIKREERLCLKCQTIDDEFHFFLHCDQNKHFREELIFKHFTTLKKDSTKLSDIEKIKLFLNPLTPVDIKIVASFIKQSLELRREDTV